MRHIFNYPNNFSINFKGKQMKKAKTTKHKQVPIFDVEYTI